MLLSNLNSKSLAIVGYQALTAKLLLKQLLPRVNQPILLINLASNPKRRDHFVDDIFFTAAERELMKERIRFVTVGELKEVVEGSPQKAIDVLFSLYESVDFSNRDKMIDNHLLVTSALTSALSKIPIKKCLLLSSIYLKDAGYVGEDDQLQDTVVYRFSDRSEADAYLGDNFTSIVEAWKWTIGYIQQSYMDVSKQIVIVRVPSLGPTLSQHQGYMSSLTSLTYLMCQVGLGKISSLDGHKNNKVDLVPADYATNLLLVLSCKETASRAEVINLSTSMRNYITLQQFVEISREAWREYGQKPAKIKIVETALGQKIKHKVERFPSAVKHRVGSMFQLVKWKIQGQRESLQQQQRIALIEKYKYFLCHEWLCQSIKTIDLYNQLTPEEQSLLNFNVNTINWKVYVKLCVYAIKKNILNQHVEQFRPQSMDLLVTTKTESYFSDIMWALRQGKQTKGETRDEAAKFVLNSKAVKDAIHSIVQDNMLKLQNPPTSYEKAQEQLRKVAQQLCTQMFSDYSMRSIRMFGWFLHKLFSNIYQKVVVNKSDIAKIQSYNQNNGPIVIIPTHRSYVDFLIMSYVFFGYGIKCPHIAAAEDFLNMAVVNVLMRRSGAFFIKRNQKKYKELYKAILNEYLSKLMLGNHFVQFFVQGTRSRTGKMLPPKYGILSIIGQNVIDGRVPDVKILPVTINYQKILEGNSFTYEMMGEAKVKESLSRVLKAVDVLKENYGRIHLQFCQMISVKEWMAKTEGTFENKIEKLGYRVVKDLMSNVVVSGPAVISTVVLMNRKGISDDSLQEQTTWLAKQLNSRGVKLTRAQHDSSVSDNSTLSLLQGILSKSKKDMFEVQVSFDQNSFVKLFTLTYYRNTLTHIFFQEAVIATALASFQYRPIVEAGISKEQLFGRTVFLWSLFENEFFLPESLCEKARFEEVLSFMASKGVVSVQGDIVKAINPTGNFFSFYWSLVWPLVESYWITCLYFFKLQKNIKGIPLSKLLTQIQWFAQSLINDHICSFLEAISSDTVKNAVSAFIKLKLISQSKQQIQGEQVPVIKVIVDEPQLRSMLNEIGKFLKTTYGKSLKGLLQTKNSSVHLDFPFLSRL